MKDARNHQSKPQRRSVLVPCALAALLTLSAAASATVEVNVTHVGFPSVLEGDVIRSGTWVPVVVDLALVGQASFDGVLRTAQFDTDGDRCFDSVEVHLRAETGGTQRLYLYALANPNRGQGRFSVELRTPDGEITPVVSQGELTYRADPAGQPIPISHDDILILSISSEAMGRIGELVGSESREVLTQYIHVAHMSPSDLPELQLGLDAVDVVVWDDARPEDLTQGQLQALIDWVRHGGTILIGASRTAGSIKLAKTLDAILPASLGEVIAVDNLPDVRDTLLDPPVEEGGDVSQTQADWLETGFPVSAPLAKCTRRDDAIVVARESSIDSDIVTRRREGRGHVIYSAITLRDLFSAPCEVHGFFKKLLYFTPLSNSDQAPPTPYSLFANVVGGVAFSTSSGVFLLVAALFSITYVGVATFGSWGVLSARGWRRHSWTVFAVVAIAASGVSVVAVGAMRGFKDQLHQISVVDADAGSRYGFATAYFGLKTGIDKELDLWLPSDRIGAREPIATPCFLRPLPAGGDFSGDRAGFADPEEYRLVPASAVIEGVRIRATLKRFEGRWEGPLGGSLSGRVSVRRGRITDDSYIVNELGVDLRNCTLLHPALDPDAIATARDRSIHAYSIGDIPADGLRFFLAPQCYKVVGAETIDDVVMRSELADLQDTWSSPFESGLASLGYVGSGSASDPGYSLGQVQNALLLLSTIGDYDPVSHAGMMQTIMGSKTWSRDRLRYLDLRAQLLAGRPGSPKRSAEAGSVVLIGFAEDPGPIRLFGRTSDPKYRPVEPDADSSWTMYRIRIPVMKLEGGAGQKEEAAEEGSPEA